MLSKNWNKIYQKNQQLSVWPWSEIVSKVFSYTKNQKKLNVLEIGCGAGANINFFLGLKSNYYGVDGSQHIIQKLKKKFPNIKNRLKVSDFTESLPFKIKFDLIIDRGSMTHNSTASITNGMKILQKFLKKKGLYIGTDWFSSKDHFSKKGEKIDDNYTRIKVPHPSYINVGKIHFSTQNHLKEIFRKWQILELSEKITQVRIPNKKIRRAYWIIVAKNK